ncbi:MAG: DUF2059 domain-containing protein [Rubripirellula sp.]|nr:DUF2059 domain-containing protein [Rubripirellula sp.]
MNTKRLLITCFAACSLHIALSSIAFSQDAQAKPESQPTEKDPHTAAVQDFFEVMKMKENADRTIDQMLSMQVKQQPQLAAFQDVMKTFLRKYVSYDATKDDLMKLYRDAFSEEEIRELTAFYRTPIGQKAISKLPALTAASAQMGMNRVQANMGELQQAIAKRQQQLQQQQQ